jgi:hypothetical protein
MPNSGYQQTEQMRESSFHINHPSPLLVLVSNVNLFLQCTLFPSQAHLHIISLPLSRSMLFYIILTNSHQLDLAPHTSRFSPGDRRAAFRSKEIGQWAKA